MDNIVLAHKLTTIAGEFDQKGLFKEADALHSLVASVAKNQTRLAQNIPNATGDYSTDIENYKKLIVNGYNQQSEEFYKNATQLIKQKLGPEQEGLFRAQAYRIRNEAQSGRKETGLNTDSLYQVLAQYKLIDNIQHTQASLDQAYINCMNYLNKRQIPTKDGGAVIAGQDPGIKAQVDTTYNLLKAKLTPRKPYTPQQNAQREDLDQYSEFGD